MSEAPRLLGTPRSSSEKMQRGGFQFESCVFEISTFGRGGPSPEETLTRLVFKKVKTKKTNGPGGNEARWLDFYTAETLEEYKKNRKAIRGQNVEVELSDYWTLEYCLSLGPMYQFVYEVLNKKKDGLDLLPEDPEERAIYLYGWIENQSQKTDLAYGLVSLLKKSFRAIRAQAAAGENEEARQRREQKFQEAKETLQESLREKLPPYILRAIDHVTANTEAPIGPPPEQEETGHLDVVQTY